jgi:hypothetical protein
MIYSEDQKQADKAHLEALNQELMASTNYGDYKELTRNLDYVQDIIAHQMKLLNAICKRCAAESRESYDKDRKIHLALRAQNQFRATLLTALQLKALDDELTVIEADAGTARAEYLGTECTDSGKSDAPLDR